MTTKKFLLSGLKLVLALSVFGAMHAVIHQFGARPLATLMAPKFTPLTADEENDFNRLATNHINEQKAARTPYCQDLFKNQILFENCLNRGFYSHHIHPLEVHKTHVIEPKLVQLQEVILPWIFGIIYMVISVFILKNFWQWLVQTAIPNLRKATHWLKNRSLFVNYKIFSNRNLSQAVKSLDDLENLYERGMINDKLFFEQKAKIKESLARLSQDGAA